MLNRILSLFGLVLVLFLLVATTLILSGYPVPAAAREWFYTALPVWIAACAAAFGAAAGWVAYLNWWKPELAKAKALQAPIILQLLRNYQTTFRAARQRSTPFEFPLRTLWVVNALTPRRAEAIHTFKDTADRLAEINDQIHDQDAAVLVSRLSTFSQTVLDAWISAQDLYPEALLNIPEGLLPEDIVIADTDTIPLTPSDQTEFQRYLTVLGFRQRHHRGDPFRVEVTQTIEQLRTLLRHHISFTTPP